jgi:hypothetical protein
VCVCVCVKCERAARELKKERECVYVGVCVQQTSSSTKSREVRELQLKSEARRGSTDPL